VGNPITIVAGAALIALAILVTNHWQLQSPGSSGGDIPAFLRLNRWTGTVDTCLVDPVALHEALSQHPLRGVQTDCKPQ
jgi:hypothetical protein